MCQGAEYRPIPVESGNGYLPADRRLLSMDYRRQTSAAAILLLESRPVLAEGIAGGVDSCDEIHVIWPNCPAPKTVAHLPPQETAPVALPSKPVRRRGLPTMPRHASRSSFRCTVN